MGKRISKAGLAQRAGEAADAAPSLADRFAHAQSVLGDHPAAIPEAPPQPANKNASVGHAAMEGAANFRAVPIELIDENPFNARTIYRPERVNELASSIGAHGQDVPGIATYRDGRYILAAGHYRRRAIKLLNLKTMDLMVHDNLTDKQLFEFSYRENAEREGQSALDNAFCWRDLIDKKLYDSETALAEAIGISLPNINKTLRLLKMSEPVLEVVKQDPAAFALTALYELALYEDVAGPAKALEMVNKIKDGDIGRKEIQEARAILEEPKQRKRKETSRAYPIQRDGAKVGSVKVWDSGRILLDVVLSDATERDSVLHDLKRQLGVTA